MDIVNPTQKPKKVAKELELFVNLLSSFIMYDSVIDRLIFLIPGLEVGIFLRGFWQIIGFVCRESEFS